MDRKKKMTDRPNVVATVHTRRGLSVASAVSRDEADFLEIRLDCLASGGLAPSGMLAGLGLPLLITARHPAEGGAGGLGAVARRRLLLDALPRAAAVDVEWRSVATLAGVLDEAARRGVSRVISMHDFRRTPSLGVLRRKVRQASQAGADVVKIATTLRGPADLATLLQLLAMKARPPLALMGMGPLGRVSRLALAVAGSCLNYGYLDRPQVPGQWPAARLRQLITEAAK